MWYKVRNFKYNGFSGRELDGYAAYKAQFIKWTNDPGIAICLCSDGKKRFIPTFALEGFNCSEYEKQTYNKGRPDIFGIPCHS